MRTAGWTSVGFVVIAASSAFADTVKLKNGDSLTGKVVNVLDGKLTLATDAAGEVKIDVAQIDTFATDDVIELHVKNGDKEDVLHGKAVAAAGGTITTDAPTGTQTVNLSTLKSVNPPPRQWTGSIAGAATATRGNTRTTTAAVDVNAVNRGDIDRLTFNGFYRAGRQEDQNTGAQITTERRVGASLKYDYFFGGTKAYAYGQSSAEKNAIANLGLRFIAGVGGGYQFIESDATKLNAEAGVSWFNEEYTDNTPSVDTAALRVAAHFEHKITATVSCFDDTELYKIFGLPRDYLVKTKGGVRENFTPSFFAQQWVEFSWDPTPATGKKRQDVTYFVGIGWSF